MVVFVLRLCDCHSCSLCSLFLNSFFCFCFCFCFLFSEPALPRWWLILPFFLSHYPSANLSQTRKKNTRVALVSFPISSSSSWLSNPLCCASKKHPQAHTDTHRHTDTHTDTHCSAPLVIHNLSRHGAQVKASTQRISG